MSTGDKKREMTNLLQLIAEKGHRVEGANTFAAQPTFHFLDLLIRVIQVRENIIRPCHG